MAPELVIIIVGCLVAASCALVGSFLVLRQMSMVGDAISHAVLPGIILAFMISGSRSPLPVIIGAGIFGLITVLLVELLIKSGRIYEDTSIGVVFPALFSIGVILIARYAGDAHIDLDCVLYGEIAYSPWDTLTFMGRDVGPKAIWGVGGVFMVNIIFIWLFFKELKITTFDPETAYSLGISPAIFHYGLMFLVSLTVVAAFESVGAILVVAMLIVPAATAYLLSERLNVMILLAVLLGIVSAVGGYGWAHQYNFSIAGGMAVVTGVLFMAAFLLSPRHGLLARTVQQKKTGRNLEARLLMLHLESAPISRRDLVDRFRWHRRKLDKTIAVLRNRGLIQGSLENLSLSQVGREFLDREGTMPLSHSACVHSKS